MKVLLVNNYIKKERIARLESEIKSIVSNVEMLSYDTLKASAWRDYEAIILSGSEYMLSLSETEPLFTEEMELVLESDRPILGICFGHQLIAHANGSRVVRMGRETEGYFMTRILSREKIFEDLSDKEFFWESHSEAVESVPNGFRLIAKGETNPVQAIKSERNEVYGVQFHPEVWDSKRGAGRKVLEAFLVGSR